MIYEFPGDGVKLISKLQSHFANMNFYDKSRYYRFPHKVTHKRGDSEMNYIKIFQNSQVLSVSVGNNYYGYQLMHIFLNNFHQGENIYTSMTAEMHQKLEGVHLGLLRQVTGIKV